MIKKTVKRGYCFIVRGVVFLMLLYLLAAFSGCSAALDSGGSSYAPTPNAPRMSYNDEMAFDMAPEPEYAYSAMGMERPEEMIYGDAGVGGESGSSYSAASPLNTSGVAEASVTKSYTILNSSMTLEVADVEQAAEAIRLSAEQLGGYIATLNFYDLTQERRMGWISLRVPSEGYSQMMLLLTELGKVRNKEESSRDVTMEYIDLEARIGNMQAQEERIRELLGKANTIEEILQIESELTRIRGNLESMLGEFKYLRDRVDYSTISINLEERDPRTYGVAGVGSFGDRLAERLSINTNKLFSGITGAVISFIGALPILIPLIILVLIIWRIWKYLEAKKTKTIKKEEE